MKTLSIFVAAVAITFNSSGNTQIFVSPLGTITFGNPLTCVVVNQQYTVSLVSLFVSGQPSPVDFNKSCACFESILGGTFITGVCKDTIKSRFGVLRTNRISVDIIVTGPLTITGRFGCCSGPSCTPSTSNSAVVSITLPIC